MPKIPSLFIAALVLTNTITGAGWWKAQQQTQHPAQKTPIARATGFAPMPSCMDNLDAKDLTYFSSTKEQVSIVYRCNKGNASNLRFYRWSLVGEPKPSNSFDFSPEHPDPSLTFALARVLQLPRVLLAGVEAITFSEQ
jgi:hypothetical protein